MSNKRLTGLMARLTIRRNVSRMLAFAEYGMNQRRIRKIGLFGAEGGIDSGGLPKSLMTRAIPLLFLVIFDEPACLLLFAVACNLRHLSLRLTS